MNKDPSIVKLVADLRSVLGATAFEILDNWDADLCAIGLFASRDLNRVVYVSSFGKAEGFFNCDCIIDYLDVERSEVADHRDDCSLEDVIELVRKHLNGASQPKSS